MEKSVTYSFSSSEGGPVSRDTYLRDQARLQRIYQKYGGHQPEDNSRFQQILDLEQAEGVSPSSSARISSPINIPSQKHHNNEEGGTRQSVMSEYPISVRNI